MEELFQTFSVVDSYGEDLTNKKYITKRALKLFLLLKS